jgi:hypothetical protein
MSSRYSTGGTGNENRTINAAMSLATHPHVVRASDIVDGLTDRAQQRARFSPKRRLEIGPGSASPLRRDLLACKAMRSNLDFRLRRPS